MKKQNKLEYNVKNQLNLLIEVNKIKINIRKHNNNYQKETLNYLNNKKYNK